MSQRLVARSDRLPRPKSHHPKAAVSSHDVTAGIVLKELAHIAEQLKLDSAGRAPDRTQAPIAARVTPEGLSVAAEIVATNPEKFADFDAAALADAAEYVQVMLAVLHRVQEIADALRASIFGKRSPRRYRRSRFTPR